MELHQMIPSSKDSVRLVLAHLIDKVRRWDAYVMRNAPFIDRFIIHAPNWNHASPCVQQTRRQHVQEPEMKKKVQKQSTANLFL